MAKRIDEMNSITRNIKLRMDREKFAGVRYQDTTPTPVCYYHIDEMHSTTDSAFIDVDSIIGKNSPIVYQKIEDFPLYDMDQIVLQIQENDQGLDTSYEGECKILPRTLKPLQNDYFTLPFLDTPYLFRITEITYDSIMPDNYYRVSFSLDYIDDEKIAELNQQVPKNQEYETRYSNIGTEENAIIEKGHFHKIEAVEEMLEKIKRSYLAMFYSERYNVLLGKLDPYGMKTLYDPYQTKFINTHRIFNRDDDFNTIMLTEQTNDIDARLKYEKSVYRFIENPDEMRMQEFPYVYSAAATYHESAFYRWHDPHVEVVNIIEHLPNKYSQIFSDEFVNEVREKDLEPSTKYGVFLKKYIRGERLGLEDIPEKMEEELVYLNHSLEVFFMVPILVYIVRNILSNELHAERKVR